MFACVPSSLLSSAFSSQEEHSRVLIVIADTTFKLLYPSLVRKPAHVNTVLLNPDIFQRLTQKLSTNQSGN